MSSTEVWPPILEPPPPDHENDDIDLIKYRLQNPNSRTPPILQFHPPLLRATTTEDSTTTIFATVIQEFANDSSSIQDDKLALLLHPQQVLLNTIGLIPNITRINSTLSDAFNVSFKTPILEDALSDDLFEVLVASMYCIIFVFGFLGNLSVMCSLCQRSNCQSNAYRNSLLACLATADFIIILMCLPLAVASFLRIPWKSHPIVCSFLLTTQNTTHGVSTFSLTLLALDRYLTVRKPKLATRVAACRTKIVMLLWFSAFMFAVPACLFAFLDATDEIILPECIDNQRVAHFRISYHSIIAVTFYVFPCIAISICHLAVANSLRKKALDDIKLYQKPRKVIIMAKDPSVGIANHKVVAASSTVDDSVDGESPKNLINALDDAYDDALFANHKKVHIPLRAQGPGAPVKHMKTIVRAHRRLRKKQVRSNSLFVPSKKHSTATRKKLANILITIAIVFAVCWLPYAGALLSWALKPGSVTKNAKTICLLLGHAHSAVNPVVYWIMNRSFLASFQQLVVDHLTCSDEERSCVFSCIKCPWTCCVVRSRTSVRWVNNSSTNLDALGPFNPKFIKPIVPRPAISMCTSHYFH